MQHGPRLGAGTGLPPRRFRGSAGWPAARRGHKQARGGQGSSTTCIHLGHGPWPLSLSSSLQGRKGQCPCNLELGGVPAFPRVHSHPTCVTLSVIPGLCVSLPCKTLQMKWWSHKTLLSCSNETRIKQTQSGGTRS